MKPVHIIAEAGTNHNASPETARRLIDVAHRAGADSVKFQIIYPEGLYVGQIRKDGEYVDNEVIATRRAGMLGDNDYRQLAKHAQTVGIPLSASVFDRRSLDLLNELDPPYIKIASCDLNNIPLLKSSAELGRPLIVSTGMSRLGEIEQAVEAITSTGNQQLVLMHCVSIYPCSTAEMNLAFLQTLKTAFGFPIGLSDHTEQSLAAAAAVAMGATWIEKHFTLDRKSAGFDHAYAMEPDSLTQYVADIRSISQALQPRREKVGSKEASVKLRARRALYAARDIQPGEAITDQDVLIVRPEGPLTPSDLPQVVGSIPRRAIRRYEPLDFNMLQRAS
jgi:N,N'-diacetyllegionaminate synthase